MLKLARYVAPGSLPAEGQAIATVILTAGPDEPARAHLRTGPQPDATTLLTLATPANTTTQICLQPPLPLLPGLFLVVEGQAASVTIGWLTTDPGP